MWNWAPDWCLAKDIYNQFPNSFSILTPFAYSYLEELIRSTTSEYGREFIDANGNTKYRKTGSKLIELAIKENAENKEYTTLLNDIKDYFNRSQETDEGANRHSVAHGYMHPRFWTDDSFQKLIKDIASLSIFSKL